MYSILKRFFLSLDTANFFRLLIAIFTFVSTAICLLIAAAHEDARIEVAQLGVKAQAIERGAEIYAQYCADCHGRKGYGIVGRGPALNNPQLFGHDYLPAITTLFQSKQEKKRLLSNERNHMPVTDQRKTEIDAQVQEIDFELSKLDQKQKQSLKSAVDFGYDPEYYDRLDQVGWKGSLSSFVLTTLIHGRPVSSSY